MGGSNQEDRDAEKEKAWKTAKQNEPERAGLATRHLRENEHDPM